mmetsp:Transcript_7603/g.11809  ORF Transcript_7603/g.11809 Transcript_7603/m.11809 type:complete len:245 (+) Transcript_7603:57-791(+)
MSARMLLLFIALIAVTTSQQFQMKVISRRRWYWVFSKYHYLRVEKSDGSWSKDLKKGDYYYSLFANGNGKGYDGTVHEVKENDDGSFKLMIEDWFPAKGGVVYVYKEVPISGDGGLEELFNGCAVEFQRFGFLSDKYEYFNCNANNVELPGNAGKAYYDSKKNDAAFTMGGDDAAGTLVRQITWPEFILILLAACVLCCGCIGWCVHRRRKKRNLEIEIEVADRYESLINDDYTDDLIQQDLKV